MNEEHPILVSLLRMQAHYSRSRHENATPSSSTSPLASYNKVPPPPPQECRASLENFGLFDKWLLMGGGHLQEVIVHGGWTV